MENDSTNTMVSTKNSITNIQADDMSQDPILSPTSLITAGSSSSALSARSNSSSSLSPVLMACVEGQKHLLQRYIIDDPSCIEMRDHCGRTPLIFCVLADRVDCAKVLLDYNADPSAMDSGRRTALHWAAHKDNYQFVKLLVSWGVDCCGKDAEGLTPIHLATHHQSTKCLAFLLKQLLPGEVDIQDDNKRTPLHWSASFGNSEHVKLLLKQDSNVGLPDSEGKTPLHWAVNGKGAGAITTAELLLDVAPSVINWQDYEGRMALHLAISEGNADMVDVLTCWDSCKMDCLDNMFRTPLHWAAVLGRAEIIKMLLERNADWSCSDANGATPLHYAAQKNHFEAVEALLSHRGVTDEPDIEGRTAVMWAAGRGADDVIEVMLAFDHDIHATDKNGGTALHAACISGKPSSVKILIQRNADIDATDMMKHTPLFRACELGHVEIANVLIEQGASLSLLDEAGRTPVHWAAYSGHINVCLLLLNAGMDPNTRDFSGRSPLHCAAYGGHTDCMELLIDNGAHINVQDKEGMTALHWCCSSGYLDAVTLLFRYLAYPNHIEFTEDRYTPLDYALLGAHQQVSQFMIEHGALSIIGIQDIAASRIQAFYRGHRVRKSFRERKLLLMKHEELRTKRRSEVLKRVDNSQLGSQIVPPANIITKKLSASKSNSLTSGSHDHMSSSSLASVQGTLYSTLSNEKESLNDSQQNYTSRYWMYTATIPKVDSSCVVTHMPDSISEEDVYIPARCPAVGLATNLTGADMVLVPIEEIPRVEVQSPTSIARTSNSDIFGGPPVFEGWRDCVDSASNYDSVSTSLCLSDSEGRVSVSTPSPSSHVGGHVSQSEESDSSHNDVSLDKTSDVTSGSEPDTSTGRCRGTLGESVSSSQVLAIARSGQRGVHHNQGGVLVNQGGVLVNQGSIHDNQGSIHDNQRGVYDNQGSIHDNQDGVYHGRRALDDVSVIQVAPARSEDTSDATSSQSARSSMSNSCQLPTQSLSSDNPPPSLPVDDVRMQSSAAGSSSRLRVKLKRNQISPSGKNSHSQSEVMVQQGVSSSLDLSDMIFPIRDKSVADTVAEERQRLSEFRKKSEAASRIQKSWRDYTFHSKKLVKTFREILRTKRFLSREQQLRREMAALTIQLAWRRYYREKIQKSLYPNRKMLHHWSEPVRVSKQSFLVEQVYGERLEVCDWTIPRNPKAARPSYFKYIPSPAALSYNFAADQYHPVMARQGIAGMNTFTQSSSRVQIPQLKQSSNWPQTDAGVTLYADELLNLPMTPSMSSDRFSYNLR